MRILLFCDFALPASCANAVRAMNLAKIMTKLGHDVKVLGVSYALGVPEAGVHESIRYEHIRSQSSSGLKSLKRVWLLNRAINAYLEMYTGKNSYDAIFLNDVYFDNAGVFRKYARKNNTKLVVNAVEWFDAQNPMFSGLAGKLKLIKNRIALCRIHVCMRNIVAISTLLGDYYSRRGCNTVVIPTLVDLIHYCDVCHVDNEKIKVVYAGIPGKKDYIVNALTAVGMLKDKERNQLEMHLYGPSRMDLENLGLSPALMQICENSIICHGKIPYDQVKGCIANADFSVLLRPNKKYANAGFPTKVGESMACGTPVIANLTSDLGKYVIDGDTGIVCENESVEACVDAFRRVLNMNLEQRNKMRIRAKERAEEGFDYKKYVDSMAEFLENLKECK